jgi:hypothetical protein
MSAALTWRLHLAIRSRLDPPALARGLRSQAHALLGLLQTDRLLKRIRERVYGSPERNDRRRQRQEVKIRGGSTGSNVISAGERKVSSSRSLRGARPN